MRAFGGESMELSHVFINLYTYMYINYAMRLILNVKSFFFLDTKIENLKKIFFKIVIIFMNTKR